MPKSWNTMELRMNQKHVSTLGKINCSQKSVYSCILPFMSPGLRNTCRFGPLTLFALLLVWCSVSCHLINGCYTRPITQCWNNFRNWPTNSFSHWKENPSSTAPWYHVYPCIGGKSWESFTPSSARSFRSGNLSWLRPSAARHWSGSAAPGRMNHPKRGQKTTCHGHGVQREPRKRTINFTYKPRVEYGIIWFNIPGSHLRALFWRLWPVIRGEWMI